MELTAARDLSKFMEKFTPMDEERCQLALECAILPRSSQGEPNFPSLQVATQNGIHSVMRYGHSAEPCIWP